MTAAAVIAMQDARSAGLAYDEAVVRRAVRAIGRSGRVRAAYLFGSQVQGTAGQDSDVDVAVLETARGGIMRRGLALAARVRGRALPRRPNVARAVRRG